MTNDNLKIPNTLLKPVGDFFEKEIKRLKSQEKSVKRSDPFEDDSRTGRNSLEEDLDEQIGHFDTEVKISFIKKQIVQFRKALTALKLGKYGVCQDCGKMIDTDRLAVRPESTICIVCEKAREK